MKATPLQLFAGIAALAFSLHAQAGFTLSLEPSSQSISAGGSSSMDLVISGLGNFTSPSLGAFALDLSYNPAVLSMTSVGFGSHLDLGVFGSIKNSDLSTPGLIHLDEVSFESAGDLHASQPSSFTLATLGFSGAGPGTSRIDLTGGSLSDEAGTSLDFATSGAEVDVSGEASVPDAGSTAGLLAMALAGLLVYQKKRVDCPAN